MNPVLKFTLDVTADSDAVLERWSAKFLADKGYTLIPPSAPWERVVKFCRRVGITPCTLGECVRRYVARGGAEPKLDRRGASRRVMAIQTNPGFDSFCLSLKKGRG